MPKNKLLLLLLCLPFYLTAQNTDQGITISGTSIRVSKVLKEISRQSGADFSYHSKTIDTQKRINYSVDQATLTEALDELARQIPIKYLSIDGQIVLTPAAAAPPPLPVEKEFILSGFLSDESTGENLIGASIAVLGGTKGTITNEFGFYSLNLKAGRHRISYSYVGFEAVETEVNLQQDLRKTVALPPASFELPEIIVGRPLNELQRRTNLGSLKIDPEKLNNLPEFGGESGLVKGLQSQPGLQTHSDGSAFFYARGGERDQNLLIIDDAPIYNPSHLLGLYSIVIPDFAKQITVHKSDLPASMGDRLSSIVSIRTKDGNLNQAEFSGALNPLISRLTVSTPLFKKKSALFFSLRGSDLRWLAQANGSTGDVRFWDMHLKWNLRINENNRLFFTSIQSGDRLANGIAPVEGIRWGNSAATLRWNSIYSPKLFSNLTLYSGNYSYTIGSGANFWKSELGTVNLKMDFTHFGSTRYTGKFGFELQSFFITPGKISIDSTIAVLPDIASDESRKNVLYYQGKFDITEKIRFNLGFRYVTWRNVGPKTYYLFDENYEPSDTIAAGGGVFHRYNRLDPRISIQFQLDSTAQVTFSYGNYHQYLQLIQNTISPFTAFEVWLPAGPTIQPQAARQVALNAQKQFPGSGTILGVAVYHKLAQNQIDYEPHATTYLNPLIESELRFGQARSYGAELHFQKDLGRLNGWLKYSYGRVFRQTQDINNNEWYRAFQDRPHDFALVLNYHLNKRIVGTAFWTSRSGSTFSSPIGFYTFNGQTVPLFGERNNDRLPAYHRLDISFRFQLHKKENAKFQHHLIFSIYNVLAHQNVFAVKFNKQYSENLFPTVPVNTFANPLLSPSQIDLVRFFPSLTYKFKI